MGRSIFWLSFSEWVLMGIPFDRHVANTLAALFECKFFFFFLHYRIIFVAIVGCEPTLTMIVLVLDASGGA